MMSLNLSKKIFLSFSELKPGNNIILSWHCNVIDIYLLYMHVTVAGSLNMNTAFLFISMRDILM